ncbi:MAG: precorrin-6y C5,15-methyltransferase (decarboxylating) subunit CbiE [Thermodesulfobacteriota bacterium]
MSRIWLIGIAPGSGLSEAQRALVARCGCVVASSRHRPLVEGLGIEVLPIAPVEQALAAVAERLEQTEVAVLASGDPLFFGIGRTLISRFGREHVEIQPALSALQLACARFGEPWDDLGVVSLHGRPAGELGARLLPQQKVFCFTDRENSPALVAQALLAACENLGDSELAASYTVRVAENLGLPDERLHVGTLAEIAARDFGDLNVMLLARPEREGNIPLFGLCEGEIAHSRGLITKDEVRAATIHGLRLPAAGVLWDIGAGSGSVSIEAARLAPGLRVYAVERNESELDNIRANCRTFGVYNVTVVAGAAPEALQELPDPDRVFVGGSGGNLAAIIEHAARRLKEGGTIVVNGIIPVTKEQAPALLHRAGLEVTISEISVSRRGYPAGEETTMNPIAIMVGRK